MDVQVDIWLRGTDFATTRTIGGLPDTSTWTEHDVSNLLKEMLRQIYQAKNPSAENDDADLPVFLRGFSWIVNPFEDKGVVIALEIQAGAAVAGPFQFDKERLEGMISRAITISGSSSRVPTVH